MKKFLISVALAAWCLAASAVDPLKDVCGQVLDTDGKPLAGVVVSDGYTAVQTDAEGRYAFVRNAAAAYVFVSVPAGCEVPLRQGHPCFYRKLDEFLVRLDICKGSFIIPPLNKLTDDLAQDMATLADLTDDDVLWDASKRALVSAWKAGCILWVLNGQNWTTSMGHLVEWLVYHDLWSKMQIFADLLKEGDTSTADAGKRGPKNMLDDLPDTFNKAQLEALRTQMGKSTEGAKYQLSQWVTRGFVTHSEETGLYTKTPTYLNGKK